MLPEPCATDWLVLSFDTLAHLVMLLHALGCLVMFFGTFGCLGGDRLMVAK